VAGVLVPVVGVLVVVLAMRVVVAVVGVIVSTVDAAVLNGARVPAQGQRQAFSAMNGATLPMLHSAYATLWRAQSRRLGRTGGAYGDESQRVRFNPAPVVSSASTASRRWVAMRALSTPAAHSPSSRSGRECAAVPVT